MLNNLEFCQLSNAITIKKICGSRKYDDREQRLHIFVSGNEIRTGRIVSWFIIIIAKVTWFKSCKYMVNIMIQIILLMQGVKSNPGPSEFNSKTNLSVRTYNIFFVL